MTEQFSNKDKAWSARFSEPVDELVKRYTASVGFDQRLAMVDIRGSLAHAEMLAHAGIIAWMFTGDIGVGIGALAIFSVIGCAAWWLLCRDPWRQQEQAPKPADPMDRAA